MKTQFRQIFYKIRSLYEYFLVSIQPFYENRAIRKLRKKKGSLNVLFFILYESNWKYESLYRLMEKDDRFNPIILICPSINRGYEHMIQNLNECYGYFSSKNYNVLCALDLENGTYRDVRSLSPDIIFYSNPYRGLIDKRYDIKRYRDVLTCYVNYFFNNNKYEWSSNLLLHRLVWRFFVECNQSRDIHKAIRKQHINNLVTTGYLPYDTFITPKSDSDYWKIKDKKIKRIIWAPHHSIIAKEGELRYSTFLLYCEFMKEMAIKYRDQIQIVFKPHPLLRVTLSKHLWGETRTNAYYSFWEDQVNTNFSNGEYINLFKSSDALIHDCGSFEVEYLYVNNPVLYLANYNPESQFNEIGKEALKCHYLATTSEQIEEFILNVILSGDDILLKKRTEFYNNYLLPPNNKTVAENILAELIKIREV